MADYIKVSDQQIGQDYSSIQGQLMEIENEITVLGEEMQMLGETWEGPTWNAFQNQVAMDLENMQQIKKKLSEFLQHMEYAKSSYGSCERKVKQMVQQIEI